MRIVLAITLLLATASNAELVAPSKHVQKMMTKGDGKTPETAFKVMRVRDEYEIARALGLKVVSQSLIIQKKPYDMLTGKDAAGQIREVWFDISSFFPEI